MLNSTMLYILPYVAIANFFLAVTLTLIALLHYSFFRAGMPDKLKRIVAHVYFGEFLAALSLVSFNAPICCMTMEEYSSPENIGMRFAFKAFQGLAICYAIWANHKLFNYIYPEFRFIPFVKNCVRKAKQAIKARIWNRK